MNTAVLNAFTSSPEYYWHERGYDEAFEGKSRTAKWGIPVKYERYYENGYRKGQRDRKLLEQDTASGEFNV